MTAENSIVPFDPVLHGYLVVEQIKDVARGFGDLPVDFEFPHGVQQFDCGQHIAYVLALNADTENTHRTFAFTVVAHKVGGGASDIILDEEMPDGTKVERGRTPLNSPFASFEVNEPA
jgi:hypothetical protein